MASQQRGRFFSEHRMASNFIPSSGAFDQFYNGSMTPPVKGPNGTLVPVPNWLPPEAIYQGMYPAPTRPSARTATL
jgi:hypothetical protein